MLSSLCNTRVELANEEESIAVQNRAFELGHLWNSRSHEPKRTHEKFLFFRTNIISFCYSSEREYFNRSNLTIVTVEDILGAPLNFKIVKK